MSQFYCQNGTSGGKISERINSFMNVENALDAREELALMRSVTADRADQYAVAHETGDWNAISVAGEMLFDKSEKTITAVERVGKHEKTQRDVITIDTLRYITTQIANFAYSHFGKMGVNDEPITEFVAQMEVLMTGQVSSQSMDEADIVELMAACIPFVEGQEPVELNSLADPLEITESSESPEAHNSPESVE